jgi:NAD+ kinase
VIAAGGYASLLRARAVAAPAGVAVLGVNVGGRGALADVEPAELTAALDVVASGRHLVADAKEVRHE